MFHLRAECPAPVHNSESMTSSLAEPPRSICILRLSAIGDTCHVVPLVRTLQQAWPTTQLTWIIGKSEARLMSLIEGVEFITVDKRVGLERPAHAARSSCAAAASMCCCTCSSRCARAWWRPACRRALKLGFDRARARELQWLFTNARIAPRTREHVLDSFFGFAPRSASASGCCAGTCRCRRRRAHTPQRLIPDARPTLVISPCSSHPLRNWRAARYAALAAARRQPSRHARDPRRRPERAASGAPGQPSSRPAARRAHQSDRPGHAAAAAGAAARAPRCSSARTPVRCTWRPWSARRSSGCMRPPTRRAAARTSRAAGASMPTPGRRARFRGCEPRGSCPGRTRSRSRGVMDLIDVDEVTAKLDELLGSRP